MSKGNKIFSGFSAKWAAGTLIFFVLLSLLAPIIANQNPLVVKENGKWYWPAFSNTRIIPLKNGKSIDLQRMSKAEWDKAFDFVVNPLFAYSPNTLDFNVGSLAVPSASKQHVLGTDELGRDVLTILIHGAKWSVGIGFGAMLLSLVIGVLLGALAGYFGESGIQISIVEIVKQSLTAFWAGFYFLFLPAKGAYQLNIILGILIVSALMLLVRFISKKWLKNKSFLGRKMTISIDGVVSRLIESLTAMPRLLFVLAAVAVFKPSATLLIMVIGILGWTRIARYTRAEVYKLRNMDFISSAKVQGIPLWRILIMHLIPNAIKPAIVSFVFGVAGVILLESALSFLGLGLPENVQTWGKLLYQGRNNFEAWWLVVFPGICIFLVVYSLNILAERMQSKFMRSHKL